MKRSLPDFESDIVDKWIRSWIQTVYSGFLQRRYAFKMNVLGLFAQRCTVLSIVSRRLVRYTARFEMCIFRSIRRSVREKPAGEAAQDEKNRVKASVGCRRRFASRRS